MGLVNCPSCRGHHFALFCYVAELIKLVWCRPLVINCVLCSSLLDSSVKQLLPFPGTAPFNGTSKELSDIGRACVDPIIGANMDVIGCLHPPVVIVVSCCLLTLCTRLNWHVTAICFEDAWYHPALSHECCNFILQ